MNDTIMASLAALKSRSQDTQFSLYSGFRSIRSASFQTRTSTNDTNALAEKDSAKTTIAVSLDVHVLDRLKAEARDHHGLIRDILTDYVRSR